MPSFKLTLKLKSKDAPEFKAGMGKGVLYTCILDVKTNLPNKDWRVQSAIESTKREMMDEILELDVEEIESDGKVQNDQEG
jgi:hypothetical protein